MMPRTKFYPQRQFHVLINFNREDERSIAVLPSEKGKFLVVDQGKVLGHIDYDNRLNCVSAHCKLDDGILSQLKAGIRNHYS